MTTKIEKILCIFLVFSLTSCGTTLPVAAARRSAR